MREIVIVVVLFGLLAFDLATNNGEWTRSVQAFVGDILLEIRRIIQL